MSKKPNKKKPAAKSKGGAKKAAKARNKAKPAKAKSKSKSAASGRKRSASKAAAAKLAKAKAKPAKASTKAKAKSGAKTPAKTKTKASKPPASKPQTKKAKPVRSKPRKRKKVVLPPGYVPSEDEPFMGDLQTQYFLEKLQTWKDEIIRQTKETLAGLTEDSIQHADIADRATSETDRALELRARDRQRKLIAKIDAALNRIEDGSYGFCEETGEPIGLKRLEARPIATLSLEAQERHERRERVYRED